MTVDPTEALTSRQLEFLALYASGNELKAIAEIKFVSYTLVQKDLERARQRVGAHSLTHLCMLALDAGVIRKNGIGYKPMQDERVIGD